MNHVAKELLSPDLFHVVFHVLKFYISSRFHCEFISCTVVLALLCSALLCSSCNKASLLQSRSQEIAETCTARTQKRVMQKDRTNRLVSSVCLRAQRGCSWHVLQAAGVNAGPCLNANARNWTQPSINSAHTFALCVHCVHAVHAVHVSAITCERDCIWTRQFGD